MKYLLIAFFCFLAMGRGNEVSKIIPITFANIEGQKNLYREGWLVIPSAQKSLQYCFDNTVMTSRSAYLKVIAQMEQNSKRYLQLISQNPHQAKKLLARVNALKEKSTRAIFDKTQNIAHEEFDYSKKAFQKSWNSILKGTIHLRQRTGEDWQRIKQIPGDYFSELKEDFSDIKKFLARFKKQKGDEVELSWRGAWNKAAAEFNEEYQKSGKQKNSLSALPYVLWGNLKALYYGLIRPSGQSIYKGIKVTTKYGGKILRRLTIYPAGGVLVVTGRTIYTLGQVVYYSGQMGIKLISSNVQAGMWGAIGLLAISSTVPTYLSGGSAGIFNYSALAVGGGVAAGGKLVVESAVETADYVAHMIYDIGQNGGEVMVSSLKSGVVLGYNAISALPAQIFLTAANGAIFLLWDGPRLSIAYVRGEIAQLPVGSVIDASSLEVEILSSDPEIIEKVIEKMPDDFKGDGP